MRIGVIESFINWIESKTIADRWSFDAAVEYAKHKGCLCVMKWFVLNFI